MNISRFFLVIIFYLSITYSLSAQEIIVNFDKISLSPQNDNRDLSFKSVSIPAVCIRGHCQNAGMITMFDGTQFKPSVGLHTYSTLIKGLNIEVRITNENATSLLDGQGGIIDISIKQAEAPFFSGLFNRSLFNYSSKQNDINVIPEKIDVTLSGSVSSGTCAIIDGGNINFNFSSTINDIFTGKKDKKLIGSKDLRFSCVNINFINLKFLSANIKNGEPTILFDKKTGAEFIFTYEYDKGQDYIPWNGSVIEFPVYNDKLNLQIKSYSVGGHVVPGNFSVMGVYQAEYN